MFIVKNKYFLIIESIRDIELRNIKKYNKFLIIYRNKYSTDKLKDLIKFRKMCRLKLIQFYVVNDCNLAVMLKSDGIYLSAHNKSFKAANLKKLNYKIIGSAHNFRELNLKIRQKCNYILLSKLFSVDYAENSQFLDIVKFSKYLNFFSNRIIPLGGIKSSNLNKLKNLNCIGFALLSEIKKKPANIINRLF
tara:strand:- start:308 stop:883 length:576 start_codon:yes stop_codon:yes gene_type:complete